MKANNLKLLKAKITELKKLGVIPEKWMSANTLAHFIARLNPLLLFSDHSIIHEMLGKRLDKNGKPTDKWVISLSKTKKLMDSEEFINTRDELMHKNFGDEVKNIGDMSFIALQYRILDGVDEMIKVGLEIGGRWTKGFKHIRVDETKKSKMIKKMVKDYFKTEDVEKLEGNN